MTSRPPSQRSRAGARRGRTGPVNGVAAARMTPPAADDALPHVTVLAAVFAAAAVLVLLGRGDGGRLVQALPPPPAAPPTPGSRLSMPTLACGLAGAAAALVLAPPLGVLVGVLLAGGGPRLLGRLEPQAVRDERTLLLQELPLVLDLLASCLAGGAALAEAASAVAAAVPGPAGRRLGAVSAALSVGSPPADAWRALAGAAPEDPLGPAARALARAADGGAPVASAVSRLAAEARADARARGEQAARRVGVLAVAPLGLCFLPAFVLLGVVPVVAGLAGPLLAGF
jgi:pilus assembly protein TadC